MKNLIPTTEALNIVDFGLLAVRQTTQGIRKSLGKEVRANIERDNRNVVLKNVIEDNQKKRESENRLELLKSPVQNLRGGVRKALTGTKGFFSGLLRAAGALVLGFIVDKLPEIIFIGERIISIIEKSFDAAKQFLENISNVLGEIKDVVIQAWENIKTGDFLDSEGKLQKEINDVSNSITKTKSDFDISIGSIQEDIGEIQAMGENEINKVREDMGLKTSSVEPPRIKEIEGDPREIAREIESKLRQTQSQYEQGALSEQEYYNRITALRERRTQLFEENPTLRQKPPKPPGVEPVQQSQPPSQPPSSGGSYSPQTPMIPKAGAKYRIAAGLLTEGAQGQAAIDVLQVVANRVAAGYGKNATEVLAAGGQFAGVSIERDAGAFRKITTAEEAAKWAGVSVTDIERTVKDMENPSLLQNSANFVKGALEFRGSPATVRAVNSDGNPNNDIQADANGIIPGSVWRGGDGDNQFLIDTSIPDPMLPGNKPTTIPDKLSKLTPSKRSITVPFPMPNLNRGGQTTIISGGGEPSNEIFISKRKSSDILQKMKRYHLNYT